MHRKKPFSVKQKKKQLQEKRKRKQNQNAYDSDEELATGGPSVDQTKETDQARETLSNATSNTDKKLDSNRYKLLFIKESRDEIQKKKARAWKTLHRLPKEALEMDIGSVYRSDPILDMPKRQNWSYTLTKQQLESKEEQYFQEYLEKINEKYNLKDVSYFELNLETWRQLWRVLEMSDVLLCILDIRYPVLQFSPALYHHVTQQLKKSMIVILNKIDIVQPELVIAWKHYLKEKYPELRIVCFTSYPKDVTQNPDPTKIGKKRKRGGLTSAVGERELLEVCKEIVRDRVDLRSWEDKIEAADIEEKDLDEKETVECASGDGEERDDVLTIGCIGYPNVGKSSLLNGLVGKKVVSVSKTPGHTKHFQTIFLTPTVKLCDCPGLVFLSMVDRSIQIIAGLFPIAQVRDPCTAVGYLAERLDLVKILNLGQSSNKNGKYEDNDWSAYSICEAWAEKCGYLTAKAARPDVYRAGNNILRMALDGRLCLSLKPPGFYQDRESWLSHPETLELIEKVMKTVAMSQDMSEDSDNIYSDEELKQIMREKDNTSDEETDDEEDARYESNNPFALLSND